MQIRVTYFRTERVTDLHTDRASCQFVVYRPHYIGIKLFGTLVAGGRQLPADRASALASSSINGAKCI